MKILFCLHSDDDDDNGGSNNDDNKCIFTLPFQSSNCRTSINRHVKTHMVTERFFFSKDIFPEL